MTQPAVSPAPFSSAASAGGLGMSNAHSYDVSVPWSDNGYSNSPIQAYASPPSVDPDRLDNRTRVDSRANLRDVFGWWRKKDADTAKRESVVKRDAIGWTEKKGGSGYSTMAPRPLGKDTGEPRPTMALGPNTYFFERPFDARIARHFTGEHFSMADHRRTFEIYGMAPMTHARNTYRIEPGPTDRDITDMPTDNSYSPIYTQPVSAPVAAVERSWRI